jgi:cytidyltransferase-like protein
MEYRIIGAAQLAGFPPAPAMDVERRAGRKKVLVTGCYDWLHSGHVRFFEEASAFGELYVVVGNDANVRNLKGEGHPLFPQELRCFMAGSIRFVHQALITSGWGWMDAEPEIEKLKPDIYLVNEDGDKPEKQEFCDRHGLEYVVLKRLPRPGLRPRSSTDLRGF